MIMSRTTDFEKALIHRDGVSKAEAKKQRDWAREMFYDMMADGCGYDDVEEMMADEFGLEMDYIFDIM